LRRVHEEIETRQQQTHIPQETLSIIQKLEGSWYAGLLQIRQHEAAVLEAESTVQATQRAAISKRRDIVQLEQMVEEMPDRKIAMPGD